MRNVVSSGVAGAVTGFLVRPCCVVPAALSLVGMSGAGLASVVVTYRPLFITSSVMTVVAAVWMTFRREGGWFNRCLSFAAAIFGFAVSSRLLGMF